MNTRTYTIPPYSDEYFAQAARIGAGARNAKAIEARCLKHPTEGFIRAFRREDIAVHGAARGWMQMLHLQKIEFTQHI